VKAIDASYTAALRFYRSKRGKGRSALDVSTFFQRRNLHIEFDKYWRGAGNASRLVFDRAWTKFRGALDEEVSA
jgi:hypothetical protein